jgi:hypothetical protein
MKQPAQRFRPARVVGTIVEGAFAVIGLIGVVGGVILLFNHGPQPFDRLAALAIVGIIVVYGVLLARRRVANRHAPSVDAASRDHDLRSNER